jgi:S1/P1 nuclease
LCVSGAAGRIGFPNAAGMGEPSRIMAHPFKRTCASLLLALACAAPGRAWNAEGHAAVGMVAAQNLTPDARKQVIKILGSDDLASIASWMDQLRSAYFHTGPLGEDPEALKFNAEFPKNNTWHYVDLPLGTKVYEPDGPFARPDDVVHMIEVAVSVLEGGGDKRITKLEALRMLVHFVGDEHQPLHVGNGFFDVSADGSVKLVMDPAAVKDLPNDKGGNADFYGPGKYDELHAYWDTNIVEKVAGGSKEAADLAPALEKMATDAGAGWKSAGDYHHWAEGWATESLAAARTAYAGITFGAETPDPKGGIKSIKITLPANYDEVCVPLAKERLAKAGYHLAEILNAIQWSD